MKVRQTIGRVGNSGLSFAPHLHVAVTERFGRSVPAVFADVLVGLNPSEDDPFTRRMRQWSPRFGYYVEPAPP